MNSGLTGKLWLHPNCKYLGKIRKVQNDEVAVKGNGPPRSLDMDFDALWFYCIISQDK